MVLRKLHCILRHCFLIGEYFLLSAIIRLTTRNKNLRRKRLVKNNSRFGKHFLRTFKIKLSIKNPQELQKWHNKAYLAVSNHTTYIDIILLAALENMVFITSVEMKHNPFLGKITRDGGCLYTNRKKFASLPREIEYFASAIRDGFKVLLFPEATSTNGLTIQPFRKSLFQVAISAQCAVLPLCIKYKTIDGRRIDKENRDLIYWYGDMPFFSHYWKLIGHTLEAEIEVLEAVPYKDGKTRQELSAEIYQQILSCYEKNES
ncbi:MAG: 1-acyl-sn-glycerol-3-phosphate acyltransferase [Candidatus Cloacimonas sp.]|jgi:1-acyl-sn-glycerol-3-phosphate acyltransferase|nr:1-acyl-sn-glycerol-3-phosphate acyltransferase [Candidatus Cloacimonas sp.]HNX03370.1 lysophospholipid acyltransferase family protein [Candidatus Cloacimonas sp.]HPS60164.1 lysophospholipid acyltransferase family protein [Candidatus Cloacimonas sp.]